jgi:hypothetical protein
VVYKPCGGIVEESLFGGKFGVTLDAVRVSSMLNANPGRQEILARQPAGNTELPTSAKRDVRASSSAAADVAFTIK